MKLAWSVVALVALSLTWALWMADDAPSSARAAGTSVDVGALQPGDPSRPSSAPAVPGSKASAASEASDPETPTENRPTQPPHVVDLGPPISVDDGYWLETGAEALVAHGQELDADAPNH